MISIDPAHQPSDAYMDSGTNRDIFKDKSMFSNLHPIRPVRIRSANGADDLVATQAGLVYLKTFDENDEVCEADIKEALFCPKIAVNLVSVTRLCDEGYSLTGDASSMRFIHPNGQKIYATRTAHSMELWSARVSCTTAQSYISDSKTLKTFNASADILHHRLGHLHSHALKRFCSSSVLTKQCTSCILAKSHCIPFSSKLPQSSRVHYRVHSDVVGPLQTPTCSGRRYIVTLN